VLENTVLGKGVSVGSGSNLKNVIIGDGMILEKNSIFENCRIPANQ
jgi:NDP-sugar pyrophosphorylase family protein